MMALLVYVVAGILWGIFSTRMQKEVYGKHTAFWLYPLVFLANLCLWPLSMICAIATAPLQIRRNEEKKASLPRYLR